MTELDSAHRRTGPTSRLAICALLAIGLSVLGGAAFAQTPEVQTPAAAAPAETVAPAPGDAGAAPASEAAAPTSDTLDPTVAALATPAEAQVPSGPQRIVVVGDNVAFGVARDIGEALADVPNVEVERLAVGSSGLVRDDFHDWPANLKDILAEPTAAVVLIIGANDRQPLRDDKGSHQPNSDDWLRLYTERVETLAGIPAAAGVPLFWIEMPIMSSSALTSTLTLTNALFRDKTEAAGGTFVETWDQFADENGRYSRSGPDLTGTQRRLRTGDGIHFTKAGYDVLAHVIAKPLRQLPALQVDAQQQQAEVEALMLDSVAVPGQTPPTGEVPNASAPAAISAPLADLPARTETAAIAPAGTAPVPDPDVTAEPAAGAPRVFAPPSNVSIGDAPPVNTRPSVRAVRVGRPFLLTQPEPGESALVVGRPRAPAALPSSAAPPAARADDTGLPTY